jgi:thioesterase domain-containing protein
MTTPEDHWQRFIDANIALTRAMQVRVRVAQAGQVRLEAPLAPNRNDKGTGFAGSLGTLATLAGWLLAQINATEAAEGAITVISEGTTSFLRPVTGDFIAECRLDDEKQRTDFRAAITAGRKGRLDLTVTVSQGDARALHFSGRYVAWLPEPPVA